MEGDRFEDFLKFSMYPKFLLKVKIEKKSYE